MKTVESSDNVINIGLCDSAVANLDISVTDIPRAVLRQRSTQLWFITALSADDDTEHPPIGPYDTAEIAVITLRLMS